MSRSKYSSPGLMRDPFYYGHVALRSHDYCFLACWHLVSIHRTSHEVQSPPAIPQRTIRHPALTSYDTVPPAGTTEQFNYINNPAISYTSRILLFISSAQPSKRTICYDMLHETRRTFVCYSHQKRYLHNQPPKKSMSCPESSGL